MLPKLPEIGIKTPVFMHFVTDKRGVEEIEEHKEKNKGKLMLENEKNVSWIGLSLLKTILYAILNIICCFQEVGFFTVSVLGDFSFHPN